MRIIRLCFVLLSTTFPLSAQISSSRHQTKAVDPFEFAGPPKKPAVLTPAKRALGQSGVMDQLQSKDPEVLASALPQITSLIQQYPNDSDLYFLRATISCETASSNKE